MISRRLPTASPLLRTAAVALTAVFVAPSMAAAADPQKARLTINDDVYNVPLGKAFAVRIGGERVTLRIDPQTEQTFEQAGVAFRYPTALEPGEGDGGDEVEIWTLQGQTTAVMIQRYTDGIDPKSLREVLVANILEREGGDPAKQQGVKLTGAERAYPGVQLRLEQPAKAGSPATQSVQNVFTFANDQGVFALIVQDVHAPDAGETEEYTETLRLLGESLTTGEAPAAPAPTQNPAAKR